MLDQILDCELDNHRSLTNLPIIYRNFLLKDADFSVTISLDRERLVRVEGSSPRSVRSIFSRTYDGFLFHRLIRHYHHPPAGVHP
jgi:hypothetical protein